MPSTLLSQAYTGKGIPGQKVVLTVETLNPTPSSSWTAGQTNVKCPMTSTNGDGGSFTTLVSVGLGGNPIFQITNGGFGFDIGDEITMSDPQNAHNTAVLTVKTINYEVATNSYTLYHDKPTGDIYIKIDLEGSTKTVKLVDFANASVTQPEEEASTSSGSWTED